MMMVQPVALYIHWPFCKAKCPYCDFNSHVRAGVDERAWQNALLAELHYMAARMPGARLGSLFFGGGTPSLMPPSIAAALIDEAARLFYFEDGIEITLEANPTSTEAGRLRDFRAAGINRASLGVQSLRADALSFLGRQHSPIEALEAVNMAKQCFDRVSFDLIYARPGQTLIDWEDELNEALSHAGAHLSLYQLTIEPNTAFHHLYHEKEAFKLPKDTMSEALFLLTQQIMETAGMPAYEISNHAVPGEESCHNLTYWRGGAYLGIGPGAHGRVVMNGQWTATQTLKSPERWLEQVQRVGHGLEQMVAMTPQERAQERLLTGLRLAEGIDPGDASLADALDEQKLAFYTAQGLLTRDGTRLRATPSGWLVLNRLLAEVVR